MTITCNLYDQWIAKIRQELTAAGYDNSNVGDQDCAIDYYKWAMRFIPKNPREIKRASEFSCPSEFTTGLKLLEDAVEAGKNLIPWQSRQIGRPRAKDGMLYDWGISHFHLGENLNANGFIEGHNEVLFAIADSCCFYEIGIYLHGDWWEFDILNIIDRNWPQLLQKASINGLGVRSSAKTRDEVKALRDGGVVTIVKLDSGRVIAPPGGGVATDGTPEQAVWNADLHAKLLLDAEKKIIIDIRSRIESGELEERDYDVRLEVIDGEWQASERDLKWPVFEKT